MADITTTGTQAEQTTAEAISFPVYMIYSKDSLNKLDKILEDYGGVGFLRIVFGPDNKETDRTIAILATSVYDALCADGYGGDRKKDGKEDRSYGRGFRAVPFELNAHSYPGEGHNKTLFVPVPKTVADDDTWVSESVRDKLIHLAEWDIIPADSWSINVPLKSRATGGVRNGCYISFKRDVHIDRIAMTRVLLADTYWPVYGTESSEERSVFRCHWAREREKRENHKTEQVETTAKDPKEIKEEKKRRAIQNVVRNARPVQKKAPIVPAVSQPSPVTEEEVDA